MVWIASPAKARNDRRGVEIKQFCGRIYWIIKVTVIARNEAAA